MTTSVAQLACDFQCIGIHAGDTIMVHASLRAVGPVEGRAEGLVSTLLSVLGNQGTLMAYVDFEPTNDIPYFDPQQSPASSDHGVLAEIIRTWPGAIRSLNPGASMVAIGAKAEWLCHDHPMNYGYGLESPLAKLIEIDGKVLLLGSDFDHVTILHYAEHCAKLPHKRIIQRTDQVLLENAVIDVIIEEFDTGDAVISTMPTDYFAQITQQFVDSGYAQTGRIGQAASVLLPAQGFISFAVDKMERDFGS
ncbi:MAG: aminoglycoside 3-N-acetyltransferase [Chloroflexi bacterium AL-W]|nr:aminoglycoside 3-N-acetyltransferase [Chloroflexi bacterium AL-N1]NOK64890.1 aminoglycoside 3-N-acetyltransferase [Chloroflexi bacterium AL-N10]NOK76660.1 aminoglycoside 3-N-acetyltransferase [Chloroflexi bacterium AL-N5]NOK84551.1 aminoglycoside 3-N-acetyltransferase [Chloroflexi bacterium AL-W]NOK86624.1 aminoglycoside 3-N-acetyltransferase [Chloroflexi bacterium AL-N15]